MGWVGMVLVAIPGGTMWGLGRWDHGRSSGVRHVSSVNEHLMRIRAREVWRRRWIAVLLGSAALLAALSVR